MHGIQTSDVSLVGMEGQRRFVDAVLGAVIIEYKSPYGASGARTGVYARKLYRTS